MTTDEHRLSRKTLNVIAASVIVSAVLLGLLYTVGTHRCLEKRLGLAKKPWCFWRTLAKNMTATNRGENRGDARFARRGRIVCDVPVL